MDTYAEDIREYNILNVHEKFKGNLVLSVPLQFSWLVIAFGVRRIWKRSSSFEIHSRDLERSLFVGRVQITSTGGQKNPCRNILSVSSSLWMEFREKKAESILVTG